MLELNKTESKGIQYEFEHLNDQNLNTLVNNSLELLYPSNIVKRIVYRPYIGKFFPNIDVISTGLNSQLSFFFDECHVIFSRKTACILCGTVINKNNTIRSLLYIPIGLCLNCISRIYYEYWFCLDAIIRNSFNETFPEKKKWSKVANDCVPCDDFLNPRCKYPIDDEKTNPCLKNHAIGLLLLDKTHLMILIGMKSNLKYQMVQMGGLLGIVLGYSNKIINLQLLGPLLSKISIKIHQITEKYNKSDEKEMIHVIHDSRSLSKNQDMDYFIFLFLYTILNYYNNHSIKIYIRNKIKELTQYLKALIKELIMEFRLEILDYVDLMNFYPPLNPKLRINWEKVIKDQPSLKKFPNLTKTQLTDNSLLELNFKEVRDDLPITLGNFKQDDKNLEIYKILWAAGQNLIVDSNISKKPVILNFKELIGKKIY